MDGLEDDAIPARRLAIAAFVLVSFERLHKAAKRVLGKFEDVAEDKLATCFSGTLRYGT